MDKISNRQRAKEHIKKQAADKHTEEIRYMMDRNFSFKQFVKKVTGDFSGLDGHWRPCIDFLPSDFQDFVDFLVISRGFV